jgi:hypothetical protein
VNGTELKFVAWRAGGALPVHEVTLPASGISRDDTVRYHFKKPYHVCAGIAPYRTMLYGIASYIYRLHSKAAVHMFTCNIARVFKQGK